jgi:hypothetical protein
MGTDTVLSNISGKHLATSFDPLGEFSHDSAILMQAFIAFAARKFGR